MEWNWDAFFRVHWLSRYFPTTIVLSIVVSKYRRACVITWLLVRTEDGKGPWKPQGVGFRCSLGFRVSGIGNGNPMDKQAEN